MWNALEVENMIMWRQCGRNEEKNVENSVEGKKHAEVEVEEKTDGGGGRAAKMERLRSGGHGGGVEVE